VNRKVNWKALLMAVWKAHRSLEVVLVTGLVLDLDVLLALWEQEQEDRLEEVGTELVVYTRAADKIRPVWEVHNE
jgi:hypothetical protein